MSAIGFGSAPLGDLYAKLDEEAAIAAVTEAVAEGVTLFDTSPHYGNGLAEHRVGVGLRGLERDAYVLSTKVGRWMDPLRSGGTRDRPCRYGPRHARRQRRLLRGGVS